MQKLIAKYGLAAHLALLAVAPLFLFPFCDELAITKVLFWISLFGGLWMVLEPSMRTGEGLSESRRRVIRGFAHDPLFWSLLVVLVFAGFRAMNTGVALNYDAERAVWHVAAQAFPLLPGSVGAAGWLPFGMTAAVFVQLQACRHSLGRAARSLYLLLSSTFAGLAAVIFLIALRLGCLGGQGCLLPSLDGLQCSFVGFAFGIHLIGAILALVAVFEQGWSSALVLVIFAAGGMVAGVIAFTPPYLTVALMAVGLIMFVYALAFARKTFRPVNVFRMFLAGLTAFVLGGLLGAIFLPHDAFAERLAAFTELRLFPERFWMIRATLSVVAFKAWVSHLWLGAGISSFPLEFRILAQSADWDLLPRGTVAVANCWWLLLAERGLVGLIFFTVPVGCLVFTYVRRLIGGVAGWELPHPACMTAPLVLVLVVATGFLDCSLLHAAVLPVAGSLIAISAASFFRRRGKGHV